MEDFDVDANEEKFLRYVLQTKRYDLLPLRIDYVERQFACNGDLVYELYFDLTLARQKEITTLIRKKCDISTYRLFKLAVQRNMKISELNMMLTKYERIGYYSVVLEEDCLELFLEQEEDLRSLLSEENIHLELVKNGSSRIIHHLCKKGEYEPIIREYLVRSLRSWNGLREKEFELLSSVCAQYASVEFLTECFMTHTSHFNVHLCKLLLRLGAKPSEEQKQGLFPSFRNELFAEDV